MPKPAIEHRTSNHWVDQRNRVLRRTQTIFSYVMFTIAAISLLVGGIGIIFGVYPAAKASRINPIEL